MFAVDILLALTIAMEAGGESWDGKCAVASVIMREAMITGVPLSEVCTNSNRYSCWRGDTVENIVKAKADLMNKDSTDWIQCAWLAKKIVDGTFVMTGTWTHFYNPKLVNPKWAESLTNVVDIGNHRFGYMSDASQY